LSHKTSHQRMNAVVKVLSLHYVHEMNTYMAGHVCPHTRTAGRISVEFAMDDKPLLSTL